MALGLKLNETRSWPTSYRGLVAIHAAKAWNSDLRSICRSDPFEKALTFEVRNRQPVYCNAGHWRTLPFGAVVCIVDLYDCVKITANNAPSGTEKAFGDYTPGRFMWKTRRAHQLSEPLSWSGRQSFFEIPDRFFTRELERLRAA